MVNGAFVGDELKQLIEIAEKYKESKMYQLFKDNKPISKIYPYKLQAIVKAYTMGYVLKSKNCEWLSCEIRELK